MSLVSVSSHCHWQVQTRLQTRSRRNCILGDSGRKRGRSPGYRMVLPRPSPWSLAPKSAIIWSIWASVSSIENVSSTARISSLSIDMDMSLQNWQKSDTACLWENVRSPIAVCRYSLVQYFEGTRQRKPGVAMLQFCSMHAKHSH